MPEKVTDQNGEQEERKPLPQMNLKRVRGVDRPDPGTEVAGVYHAPTPSKPPTRALVSKARQEMIALTRTLDVREAVLADAAELADLYHSLEYDHEAPRTMASHTVGTFKETMKLSADHPERIRLINASKVFRGGGVFSPTPKEEWEERIKAEGDVVLVYREKKKDQSGEVENPIIAVHSYYRGSMYPDLIKKKIQKMGDNMTREGKVWLESVKKMGEDPFEKVYMIRDSMISSEAQGSRLLLRLFIDMLKHELNNGHIQLDQLSEVAIMYYVNLFEGFTCNPEEENEGNKKMPWSLGIQSNRATVRATESMGAYLIGTTLPDQENPWVPVMRLDDTTRQLCMKNPDGSEGLPIFASKGDLDYVIPVGASLATYLQRVLNN